MKVALGWLIVLLGIAVIGIDQYRIVATDHDFHWMPIACGALLMFVGLYPDRVLALLERIAPAAVAKWTGKTGEHPKVPAVELRISCEICGAVVMGTGKLCADCLERGVG